MRILGLGGVLLGDCLYRAAKLLELYVGLEAEWTIRVWFKGVVRLLNLLALPKIKVIVVPRRQLCLEVVTRRSYGIGSYFSCRNKHACRRGHVLRLQLRLR